MSVLIGTTRKEHLQDSIDALSVELASDEIKQMESLFPEGQLRGFSMRNFTFRNGRIEL